jgi:hypothetical protein
MHEGDGGRLCPTGHRARVHHATRDNAGRVTANASDPGTAPGAHAWRRIPHAPLRRAAGSLLHATLQRRPLNEEPRPHLPLDRLAKALKGTTRRFDPCGPHRLRRRRTLELTSRRGCFSPPSQPRHGGCQLAARRAPPARQIMTTAAGGKPPRGRPPRAGRLPLLERNSRLRALRAGQNRGQAQRVFGPPDRARATADPPRRNAATST